MIVCPRAVVFSFRTANSEYTQKSSKISYIYLCVQESLNARRGNKLSPSSGTFSSQNVKNDASNIVYSRDGANCNYKPALPYYFFASCFFARSTQSTISIVVDCFIQLAGGGNSFQHILPAHLRLPQHTSWHQTSNHRQRQRLHAARSQPVCQ